MSWQTERAKPNITYGFSSFSGVSQPECQSTAKCVLCVSNSAEEIKNEILRVSRWKCWREMNVSVHFTHKEQICISAIRDQTIAVYWSLSFLSSCLSLLEHAHTHKHQMLSLLADDRCIVWWISDMFHPENSVSRWLITQFMSNQQHKLLRGHVKKKDVLVLLVGQTVLFVFLCMVLLRQAQCLGTAVAQHPEVPSTVPQRDKNARKDVE